jgi:hypothetical protein
VAEQLLLGRRRDRLHAICSGEAEDQLGMRNSSWWSAMEDPGLVDRQALSQPV